MRMAQGILYVLLAGGRSRRFGRDKRRVRFRGQCLWDHALAKLQALGGGWVVVEPGCSLPVPPGVIRMEDPEPYAGPAVALAQALKKARRTGPVVVFPVDMPLLPVPLLQLLGKRASTGEPWAWVVDPDHPLPLALTPAGVPAFLQGVDKGITSFRAWLATLSPDSLGRVENVSIEGLYNVNRPEDLEWLLSGHAGGNHAADETSP